MAYHAVRTERHKYIRYTDLEGMDELANSIDAPEAQETLAEMQSELAHFVLMEPPYS